jgi:hypothetical protein
MVSNQTTTSLDELRRRLKLPDSAILEISDLDIDDAIRVYIDRRCTVMRGDETSLSELRAVRDDLLQLLVLQIPSIRLSIIAGLERVKTS